MFNLGYTPEVAEIGWAGLPPAILKHAGGMFHLLIIEGRPSIRAFAGLSAYPG